MASLRTQVYLTAEQRRRIDLLVDRDGHSLAHIIRSALDRYLDDVGGDASLALEETFGATVDIAIPSRGEWHRG